MPAIAETSQATLRQMIDGYRVSQLICVAAELGIADRLATGAKHYEALAAATRTHAPSLFRLLRALTSAGVFTQTGEGRFALNPLAELLRSDAAGSLRPWALVSASTYRTWGHLDHSIKTGETAFDHIHGMDSWTYRERHPEEARVFNDAMSAHIALMTKAIVNAYEFSLFTTIMDVGGGQGTLLAAILKYCPDTRGILLDIPTAIREAKPMIEAAALDARCQLVEGSFFDFVPRGADAYIPSRVLHDWNDDQVLQILANLRKAMKDDAKLLIIERVLDLENPAMETTLSDLHMLVRVVGRERTTDEFRGLLASSGFTLAQTWPTRSPFCIIEAAPS